MDVVYSAGDGPSHSTGGSSRSHRRVLLVEPHPGAREVLQEALKSAGFRVYVAPDLEAGLHALRRIDAAVLAVEGAPAEWSITTLRREHPKAQVVLLGDPGPEFSLPPRAGFLPRPVDIHALLTQLKAPVGV